MVRRKYQLQSINTQTTMMHGRLMLGVVLLGLFSNALGALTISNVLGDNMVLQRGVTTRIWGWDTAGASITATISSVKYFATAQSDGSWVVSFTPREAGGPYNISITDGTDSLQISNVLFGDVWVCSGQSNILYLLIDRCTSRFSPLLLSFSPSLLLSFSPFLSDLLSYMAFPLSWAFNSSNEIADTANYPKIRVFNVGDSNISSTPVDQLIGIAQPWSVPAPASMSGFSAVCWFHARNLYLSNSVPLGLIESAWGGTIIEAWSSPDALQACNGRENKIAASAVNPNQNSVLWNAMIYPLLPTAIFGVLWYQGEQNTNEPALYGCREQALINDWRQKFGTQFIFNFVQLAPWSGNENSNVGTDIPDTREAQLEGLLLPRVTFATAVDLGDSLSPYNDIHPRFKQEVGKRLATSTLAVAFGENLNYGYPQLLKGALVSSSPDIVFNIAVENVGSGLYFVNNTCPSNVPVSNCTNFAVVLSDGNTYPAVGSVNGTDVVEITLPNPNNLKPTTLYYGYSSWPVLTIFRKDDGYPLLPFKLTSYILLLL